MTASRCCSFLIPGDWLTPTGGFTYDRRLVLALREAGWHVDLLRLDAEWPWPDAAALNAAQHAIESLPDGRRVIADGLAFGALPPALLQAHAHRLCWVALVHHPLHLETGLDAAQCQHLLHSETRALQHARRVLVTSAHTAADVAAMGVPAERIVVIEPGTDAAPVVGRPRRHDGPLQLLCVASLTPRKGHALLLQALAGLPRGDWELHNVGSLTRDPATTAQLLAMCDTAPLAGRVFWHGEVDAAQLQPFYARAELLLQPSLHEGYGMAVAEALAAGLPVLASDAGALAQTLPPDAGLHVPAGDVSALRDALARLLGDAALLERLAAGARAAALHLPRWPQQAQRLAALLDGLA